MFYFRYLSYLLRHKWFVFIECCRMGMPIRGLMHDMSKFRPSEFIPYARWFYGKNGVRFMKSEVDDYKYWMDSDHQRVRQEFDMAWLLHQKRNPHHWQYWLSVQEDATIKAFDMPDKFCMEMVADWRGAGRARGHGDDIRDWYLKKENNIVLGEITRARVELLIGGVAVIE